jgi:hypothetical protein
MTTSSYTGDIFSLRGIQGIGVTVNAVGVMGKGLALTAKLRWPQVYVEYKALCDLGARSGRAYDMFPALVLTREPAIPRALLIATKRHWRDPSRLDDVVDQAHKTARHVDSTFSDGPALTFAIPPLGCGLGGLDYRVVKPILEKAFAASRHTFLLS